MVAKGDSGGQWQGVDKLGVWDQHIHNYYT